MAVEPVVMRAAERVLEQTYRKDRTSVRVQQVVLLVVLLVVPLVVQQEQGDLVEPKLVVSEGWTGAVVEVATN